MSTQVRPAARSAAELDWWGAVFIAVTGSAWHFVYAWSGDNSLLGLVAPVNESVWEHTKLVAIPSLLWNALAAHRLTPLSRLAWAAFLEACAGPAIIVAGYYAYTAVLGRGWFVADMLLFFTAVAVGRLVNRTVRTGHGRAASTAVSLALIGTLLGCFAWLTVAPPPWDPFAVPQGYGAGAQVDHGG